MTDEGHVEEERIEHFECVVCDATIDAPFEEIPDGWEPVNVSRGEARCPDHALSAEADGDGGDDPAEHHPDYDDGLD